MVCKCGYQNEPDDFYCAQCGRRLTGKKSGKGWIIAIVVVLALAAGALAMWLIMSDENSIPEESTSEGQPEGETGETPPSDENAGEQENHWSEDHLYYYENGEMVTGLHEIDGAYYYFAQETGRMQTGWQEINGSWHFFTEEGPAPGAGWYSDNKGWFYLEENGMHQTQSPILSEDGNKEYNLDSEGYLETIRHLKLTCIVDKEEVNGRERRILKPVEQLSGCVTLTFTVADSTGGITAVNSPVEEIWIRVNGNWSKVPETAEPLEEGAYRLTFTGAVSFDAICILVGQEQTAADTLTDVVISYE